MRDVTVFKKLDALYYYWNEEKFKNDHKRSSTYNKDHTFLKKLIATYHKRLNYLSNCYQNHKEPTMYTS